MKIKIIISFLFLTFNFNQPERKVEKKRQSSALILADKTQDTFKASQLIGKWYFLSKENDKKTKTQNLIDGKYIKLTKNRNYELTVFENNASGKWEFDAKTQILVLENENNRSEWKLSNVNTFGMVLVNLTTKEKWMFALED